jgi:hypothetical protein
MDSSSLRYLLIALAGALAVCVNIPWRHTAWSLRRSVHSIVAPPDALFENWTAGDYELLATAAARDFGVPGFDGFTASLVDLNGDVRPIGAAIDAGAIEFRTDSLPGDFNHDDVVDAADYTVWRNTNGTPEAYQLWKSHFGQSSGGAASAESSNPVPEPTTVAILVILAAGHFLLRRV